MFISVGILFLWWKGFHKMSDLNSKAKAISTIVFSVIALLFLLFPVNYILIKVVVGFLAVFTYILHFIALKKKGLWNLFSWIWSAFFLPLFSAEMLVMGYISQFVSVETIAVWGLPIFLSLIPSTLWVLMKWFRSTFSELY